MVGPCQCSFAVGKFMSNLIVGTNPTSQFELSLPRHCMGQRVLVNQDLRRFRSKTLFAALSYLVAKDLSSPTRVESLDLHLYMAEFLEFASAAASPPRCTFAFPRGR